MKFTIMPDWNARKLCADNKKQIRADKRERRRYKRNARYLKRRRFTTVWLVCFLISVILAGIASGAYIIYDSERMEQAVLQRTEQNREMVEYYLRMQYKTLKEKRHMEKEELDAYLGACMYRIIPMREYEGVTVASAIYNAEGTLLVDSRTQAYLYQDDYEEENGNAYEHVQLNLSAAIYRCAQSLPEEFYQRYESYYLADSDSGKSMKFGAVYLDQDTNEFYFSKVCCLEYGMVVWEADFTPAHVDGLEKTELYPEERYIGSNYSPVIYKPDAEAEAMLEKAKQSYLSYHLDENLGGASEMGNGFMKFTLTDYTVIQVADDVEYGYVASYSYHYIAQRGKYLVRFLLIVLLGTLGISFLWARFRFVRMKARYEFEDFQKSLTTAMAHDLKSPLMILSGMAENLKENVHTEKREYYADEIQKHIADMNHMIEQSLGYAKLSQEETLSDKKKLEIRSELQTVLENNKMLYEEKNMEVILSGSGIWYGNEALLRKMFDNLVQNAIFHGEENGIIAISIEGRTCVIRNSYSGDIKTEDAARLLKPYEKDESRKRTGGHGLGLSIVNEIVKLHGGSIKIEIKNASFSVTVSI